MTPSLTLVLAAACVFVGLAIYSYSVTTNTSARRAHCGAILGLLVSFGGPAAMFAYARYRVAHDPPRPPTSSSSSTSKPGPMPSCT